jgi:hypothetical protein
MLTVAALDFFGKWRSGATGNFSTGVVGATVGNRLNFGASRTQFRELAQGEREGARTAEVNLLITTAIAAVSGDDYALVIT